jgi:hypothetical protein
LRNFVYCKRVLRNFVYCKRVLRNFVYFKPNARNLFSSTQLLFIEAAIFVGLSTGSPESR